MPEISETALWIGLVAFLLVVLTFDLLVFHRKTRVISFNEAILWTSIWALCAFGFAGLLYVTPNLGPTRAQEFLTGYVLEQALSVDNLFVFVLIFAQFAVPAAYQHRVLFWGILGAIVLRGGFILLGSEIIHRFEWVLYIFGAFLLYTGFKLFLKKKDEGEHEQLDDSRMVRLLRRFLPLTKGYRHEHFFVREDGKLLATPLFLVLVIVELSDLIFAVDSIPTIFVITTHGLIVFAASMFAILGLRSIYIVLERLLPMFRFLERAVAMVLVFIGAKILLKVRFEIAGYVLGGVHISEGVSLGVVATLLVGSVVLSMLLPSERAPEPTKGDPSAPDPHRASDGTGEAPPGAP